MRCSDCPASPANAAGFRKLVLGAWLAAVPVKNADDAPAPVLNAGLIELNRLNTSPNASMCMRLGRLIPFETRRLKLWSAAPRPQLIVVQDPSSFTFHVPSSFMPLNAYAVG